MSDFLGFWGVLIEKVFPLYLFRYAYIIFLIKNENRHRNHDQGGLKYFRRIKKYCTNRRSRPSALNAQINLEQCPPDRMLPNPA